MTSGITPRTAALGTALGLVVFVLRATDVGIWHPTIGLEGGAGTPARTLAIPLLGWALIGLWVAVHVRPLARAAAVAALLAFGMDMSMALAEMWLDPERAGLNQPEVLFVLAAQVAGSGAAGYVATTILRAQSSLYLPLAVVVGSTAARLATALEPLPLVAMGAGAMAALRFTTLPRPRLDTRAALVAIFLLGLAIRAALVVSVWRTAGAGYPLQSYSGEGYDDFARILARGEPAELWIVGFNGYMIALAAAYKTIGRDFLIIGMVQAALGAMVPIAMYYVASRIAGPVVGLLTALGTAIDSLLITASADIGREALGIPTLAGALAATLAVSRHACHRRAPLGAAGAGSLAGVAVLMSPALLGLVALLSVWLYGASRRLGLAERARSLMVTTLFLTSAALVVGGFETYRASYPVPPGVGNHFVFAWAYVPPWDMRLGQRLTFADAGTLVRERPLEVVQATLEAIPRNADGLFFTSVFNRFDPLFLVARTPFAASLEVYVLVSIGVGLGLAAFGRVLARPSIGLVLGVLAYMIVVNIMVFSSYQSFRYRAPYDLFFALFAALGAVHLVTSARVPADGR